MTRTSTPLMAALMLIGALAAGCSGESSTTGTAGSSGEGRTTLTARDKGVKFAECLRTHGVPDFPDPNANGEFVYGVSVSPTVFTRATDACTHLQPPGALSTERTPEQRSASLRFADCMRDNGVKDFPDPVDGEPLVDTTKIPSSDAPDGMTVLNAAMEACRTVPGLGLTTGGHE
jgi:hypothetical protein